MVAKEEKIKLKQGAEGEDGTGRNKRERKGRDKTEIREGIVLKNLKDNGWTGRNGSKGRKR